MEGLIDYEKREKEIYAKMGKRKQPTIGQYVRFFRRITPNLSLGYGGLGL